MTAPVDKTGVCIFPAVRAMSQLTLAVDLGGCSGPIQVGAGPLFLIPPEAPAEFGGGMVVD